MKKTESFLFFIVPIVFFLFFFISIFFFFNSNVDVGWHIQVAKFILEGKLLYRDIIEVNFPLIYYTKIPPVLLSEFIDLNVVLITRIYHVALTIFFFFISIRLILSSDENYRLKLLFAIASSYALFINPLEIYGSQLGQKENYFIMFFLPYFLLNFLSFKKEKTKNCKILLGIFAAIAVCSKPYFAIIIVFFEIGQFVTKGSISARIKSYDFRSCLIFCLLFCLIFVLFFFEYYLSNIWPIIKYNYFNHSVLYRVNLYRYFDWPAIVLFPILAILIRNHRRLIVLLFVFLGGFIALMLQNESIYSVKMPMYVFKAFLLCLMLDAILIEYNRLFKNKSVLIFLVIPVIFLAFKPVYKNLTSNFVSEFISNKPKREELLKEISDLGSKKVFILTQKGLGVNFPMVHLLGIDYIWNYSSFWVVPEKYFLNHRDASFTEEKEINKILENALKSAADSILSSKVEYLVIFKYSFLVSKKLEEKRLIEGLLESDKRILDEYEYIGYKNLKYHEFFLFSRKEGSKL